LRRMHVVWADRAWSDDVEEVWVCRAKEEVDGVEQEMECSLGVREGSPTHNFVLLVLNLTPQPQ
jgi:hypothetical protein